MILPVTFEAASYSRNLAKAIFADTTDLLPTVQGTLAWMMGQGRMALSTATFASL